ncbi:uncharacterized protein BXZ73DRAFT_83742 [Epithele typhae]|uniref:uncharacterized protein n=1 Tax=Epithele typhae TaxID=378194 RepID=UPI002007DB94|nr:uncharacterized protein BXZ73DRAFT_83742 [Epithele typhae]KAH9910281.1 hypothetical protein BXZ73DRAFT_83742 [Epithele typhae]
MRSYWSMDALSRSPKYSWSSTLWNLPPLRACTALTLLKVKLSTATDDEPDDSTRRQAARSAQAFDANVTLVRCAPPSVRTVVFRLEHVGAASDAFFPTLRALPWAELDDALAVISGLETVMCVARRSELLARSAEYGRTLEEFLPRMRGEGKLRIIVGDSKKE